jgi:hypothetical protein
VNVDTGELRKLMRRSDIPNGFVELLSEEAAIAEKVLGNNESMILHKNHPLRIAVTERVKSISAKKKKSQRDLVKRSRKANRRK